MTVLRAPRIYTEQELFDIVGSHLLTQGAQSSELIVEDGYGKATRCLYRNPKGLMCAVGCLIPDDVYKPSMENQRVDKLSECVLQAAGLDSTNLLLANALQDVHDFHSVKLWREKLFKLANMCGLSTDALPKGKS